MRNDQKRTSLKVRRPPVDINDAGTVRIGSSNIAADLPSPRRDPDTSDTDTVRIGSSNISADFPA